LAYVAIDLAVRVFDAINLGEVVAGVAAFVTFRVTVFEIALPFFGVTVTVTLQEPAFNPLRVVPETLQNLDELAATFNLTFDVESTLSLANAAIDLAEAALESFTVGVIALGVVVGVETTGVLTIVVGVPFCVVLGDGADVDVVFQPGVVCFTDVLDPSPLPFHDEITKS
jgi:hypothetical protein